MGKRSGISNNLAELEAELSRPDRAIKLAETILRIRDKSGRIRPLAANRAQTLFEQRRGRGNIILKARQMGMTTWVAGRFFLRTALKEGTTSLLVAHNRESAESIFGVVRRMWEELPEDLQGGVMNVRRHNVGEIALVNGSEFRVASAADVNAGRGMSLQNLHCSEVSRWPGDAGATLAGLRAALAPDGELVLESTPNGACGAFYEAWKTGVDSVPEEEEGEPQEGAGLLVRHFFPWWLEPSYVRRPVKDGTLTGEERALMEREGLSAAQIGYRRTLENGYGVLRSQEFAEDAETCFRTAGSSCFEIEAIERRLAEIAGPLERRRNGALLQWLRAVPGRSYVLAVDTAGGGSDGDFAAVQVVDLATGMQCCELQERLRPAELARVCTEIAAEYGALVAVERNNHGAAVLALLEMKPEVCLYRQAGQAGWLTTAANKPEAVARLGVLLDGSATLFHSQRLLAECRTFVADERGRAGAVGGAHDDLVMAMAIAQAVRAELLVASAGAGAVRSEKKTVESFFPIHCM